MAFLVTEDTYSLPTFKLLVVSTAWMRHILHYVKSIALAEQKHIRAQGSVQSCSETSKLQSRKQHGSSPFCPIINDDELIFLACALCKGLKGFWLSCCSVTSERMTPSTLLAYRELLSSVRAAPGGTDEDDASGIMQDKEGHREGGGEVENFAATSVCIHNLPVNVSTYTIYSTATACASSSAVLDTSNLHKDVKFALVKSLVAPFAPGVLTK
ncbi:uncharacterized protein LAESUDRAFT_715731 [Laetiporus sulphureus 93-53]|uniref:Uncharacterized protein n=1 Tax=Laetiporus sulphureus 93-53 TaxID=1314785 RepID=A0A165D5N5_9APHY|nr:uncharacterized protein LAESUDRAFT_715731 [Laetiporus sulphureus 93-53]KZT04194.1 hypothetical protein LAESUDRAFT_715731 [Laetiporus sulphureus 93-53]